MRVAIGDYICLVNGDTYLTGTVTGWHVLEGELYSIRIEHVGEPLALGAWKIMEEESEDE